MVSRPQLPLQPRARRFSSGLVLDGDVLTGLFSAGSDTLSHASSGQMALTLGCSTSESVSLRTFFVFIFLLS